MLQDEQGKNFAKQVDLAAFELGIPAGTAVFLEIDDEAVTKEYMLGFAKSLMVEGYTPTSNP